MKSSDRLTLAEGLSKVAMMGKIMQVGQKVAPSVLRGVWSNMGTGARIGAGMMGAGGLYGAYRMMKPNAGGILARARQSGVQQSNDLNQVYDFANGRH